MLGIAFAVAAVVLLAGCGGLLVFMFVRAEHDSREGLPRGRAEEVARSDVDHPSGRDQ